jgi:hypothetical protein
VTLRTMIFRLLPRGMRIGAVVLLYMLNPSSVANPKGHPVSDSEKGWALLDRSEGPGHAVTRHGPTVIDVLLQNRITNDGVTSASKYSDATAMGEAVWQGLQAGATDTSNWMMTQARLVLSERGMRTAPSAMGMWRVPTVRNESTALRWPRSCLRRMGKEGGIS